MKYRSSPKSIFRKLLMLIFLLLGANIMALVLRVNTDSRVINSIASLFDFNREANLPSLYATITLLACAVLLFYLYRTSKREQKPLAKQWLLLSVVFAFLALDEIASIHERFTPLMKSWYDFDGFLYYAWVIPYGLAIAVLGFICIPFLQKLPKNVSFLFIIAAIVFVSGAIGLELLGGQHDELYGQYNLQYMLYYTLEELLEMLGVAIFIYGLLTYIVDHTNASTFKIKVKSSKKAKKDPIANKVKSPRILN